MAFAWLNDNPAQACSVFVSDTFPNSWCHPSICTVAIYVQPNLY